MSVFTTFLEKINSLEHRYKLANILDWIQTNYPQLVPMIKWNQPMFTDHDTFIIGFSVAKQHIAITIEKYGMDKFRLEIENAGYEQTMMLFKIKWEQTVNYGLLERMIAFKINDKLNDTHFWKK